MRCALLQLNPLAGDINGNREAILTAARKAGQLGAELCITPELALVGYPPRDLLLFDAFVRQAEQAALDIARALADGPALILGTIGPNVSGIGKPLHNQALFLEHGIVKATYNKQLLPAYDVFDERRYFEPGQAPAHLIWQGKRLALTICEDIWNDSPSASPPYASDPVSTSAPFDMLINLSASPFTQGKQMLRQEMLAGIASRHKADVVYVNQVGGNDELVFDGRSMYFSSTGRLTRRAAAFAEDLVLVDTDSHAEHIADDDFTPEAEIWQALVLGTRDYVRKIGMSQVVLGLSGGVDSALVAAIACEALGAEHVTGILMPSPWSSDHSLSDARELAHILGMPAHEIPIEQGMQAFSAMLAPVFSSSSPDIAPDLTAENIQARIRGVLLMAFSNKHGALLLTTGNKSEISVGYCTIYGDMCGGLAVIADLSKTQVYRLCRWLNAQRGNCIPDHILTKAPSAELRPGQTDQDSLPPYDQLDAILHMLLVERQPIASICAAGNEEHVVRHVAALVARSEFKRRQAAPGLKITEQAFGLGWRMPIACHPPYLF